MPDIEQNKLTEIYTLRIPASTKSMIDTLSPEMKTKLNQELRVTMARILHEAKFDPSVYLSGD